MNQLNRSFVFVLLFLSQSAFAGFSLDQTFELLKDSGENYEITGAVCEQVARLELQREYPAPAYEVKTGIAYADAKAGRVIGELDVVVFRNADERAVLVAEVKCWKNMPSGQKKARQQRSRFLDTLQSGKPVDMYLVSRREIQYDARQFDTRPQFISIAQEGSTAAGFDRDLDFSLDELMRLRERLMSCQKQGSCKRH